MLVPLSFRKLGNDCKTCNILKINYDLVAMTRGQDTEGAVPGDTTIIFAVGGWHNSSRRKTTLTSRYEYSVDPNPWAWLESKEAAEEMALQVSFCLCVAHSVWQEQAHLWTRWLTGSNMEPMGLTWIWRPELETNRSDFLWALNYS